MIRKILAIRTKEDYRTLTDIVPGEYLSAQLIDQMMARLSPLVKTVVIEYPYVDKDYRSTYYGFYSKRHRFYDKFCFRLHFFKTFIYPPADLRGASNHYLGSMVLRPTEITPLGRTLLSPDAIRDFEGYICEARYENNLLGLPLEIKTFPHTMQDTDVTVCAHSVCWMISRYYSEKYSVYPERLTFDIAEAVTDLSKGRIIPSKGLTLGQVSEIFSSIGFYPEVFVRQLYPENDFFYDLLYAYVESGIPVVGALGGKQHAVAIVGHGPLLSAEKELSSLQGAFANSRHLCQYLVVNDDNYLPFESIGENDDLGSKHRHRLTDVDAFIVPLYEKMYLNAENVLRLFSQLANSGLLTVPDQGHIARIFMTSSRSYKRKLIEYDHEINNIFKFQLELPMPKFIWLVELASYKNYDNGLVDYRWVIDATANQYEKFPFLFIHDKDHAVVQDRALTGKMFQLPFKEKILPFRMYENNLRRYACRQI